MARSHIIFSTSRLFYCPSYLIHLIIIVEHAHVIQLQGKLCRVPFFKLTVWHRKGRQEWPGKLGPPTLALVAPCLDKSSGCCLGTPLLYASLSEYNFLQAFLLFCTWHDYST